MMDVPGVLHVRDLRGEDLDRFGGATPGARIRFLVEAGEALAAGGDGDVLVIGTADEVCAAAAAGYHAPLGDTRVVTARGLGDHTALRRLLADVEARSIRRRGVALVSTVDVLDEALRHTFELLGWAVTGAGVAVWTDRTSPGEPECRVDTWTLRKDARAGA
ncbi:hypothetical protein [Actinomycetospora sp. TBRC 11914]|uniref:hypothetical protein n=1 Tax=Actinomycetospora sp. TBRC 11914 TaxID=2729387 RepID=UPI00145CCFD6|nr:hypothetical protein [Actinomycetospora sp. TBRC 11914]NMO93645.1 hypothetical protein [Actinomycetospora sp. TBRC 11914]